MTEAKKKAPARVGVYELGKKIGKGAYSTVRKATNIFTQQEVAVKHMKPLSYLERTDIEREIAILKLLKHPSIVELIDVIDDVSGDVFMVFELVTGGDVFDHLVARGRIVEKEARRFFRDCVSALEYCHAHLVVHRDLKPENLLLDAQGGVKITDFGLSNIMRVGARLSTYCGSPVYMAPEILTSEEYGPEVDIWSLGVVLFTLLVGHPPWRLGNENVVEDMDAVLNARYHIPESCQLSPDCLDIISKMLVPDRSKRATLQMVKTHPWTCEGYDSPPTSMLQDMEPVEEIDDYILGNLETMGYDVEEARVAIMENRKCPENIVYHLLLKQFKDEDAPDQEEDKQKQAAQQARALARRRTTVFSLEFAPPQPQHGKEEDGKKKKKKKSKKHKKDQVHLTGLPQHWNGALCAINEEDDGNPPPRKQLSTELVPITKHASDSDTRHNEPSALPVTKIRRLSIDFAALGGVAPHLSNANIRTIHESGESDSSSTDSDSPRIVKGAFSVDTTTTKQPEDVMEEILRTLKQCNFPRKRAGYVYSCKVLLSRLTPADGAGEMVSSGSEDKKSVKFDIEVCKIEGLQGMLGVKFKRKSGNVWGYKTACKMLTDTFKL